MKIEDAVSQAKTRHYFKIKPKIDYDKPVTEEETRLYGNYSKKLLIYGACLNSAMVDLETELSKAGILRHSVKRNFNRVSRLVEKISTALDKGVAQRISKDFCHLYTECMENAILKAGNNIYTKQPEKAYNVVMSLIRLTLDANNNIGRYKQQYITALDKAPALLECGLKDYKLDIAIAQAINEVALP